jgi:hypothetical protein
MLPVIDLNDSGLTLQQVLDSVSRPTGAILRRGGRVIARIEPADDIDLEDEAWAHAPEQVARGQAARERFARGEGIPHEQLKRELGLGNSGSGP